MGILERLRAKYNLVFLVISFGLIVAGLVIYFHQGIQLSHFSMEAISFSEYDEQSGEPIGEPIINVRIAGQYKTVGEGFFVGKRVTISALLYLEDTSVYEGYQKWDEEARIVFIKNSEDPDYAKRDVSKFVEEGNINEAHTNLGTLKMTRFFEDGHTIALEGDIVFTKPGSIEFGMPLDIILSHYGLEEQGASIEPSYVAHQIRTSRIGLLLAFVTLSIASLSLYFSLSKKSKET